MRFQKVTSLALKADYVECDWFDHCPSLKFATAVTNRNELFASTLEQYGHYYEFKPIKPDETHVIKPDETHVTADVAKETEGQIDVRTTKNHVELDEATIENEKINTEIHSNTLEWLATIYKTSRGFELGTFDNSLIAMTMKTQSSKWEGLALGYISDIVSMAHTFIIDLLQLICPDPRVRNGLMSVMMENLMAKYKGALDHVHFLLYVERMGRPTTLNISFHENLENRFVVSYSMLFLVT